MLNSDYGILTKEMKNFGFYVSCAALVLGNGSSCASKLENDFFVDVAYQNDFFACCEGNAYGHGGKYGGWSSGGWWVSETGSIASANTTGTSIYSGA